MINNLLNCWKTLKLFELQHKDEMPKCDSDESRKNQIDGARLNPKLYIKMGNQQPSLE